MPTLTFTQDELEAILGAVEGCDDEYGFKVGPDDGPWDSPEQYQAACDRGQDLIQRLRVLVEGRKPNGTQ